MPDTTIANSPPRLAPDITPQQDFFEEGCGRVLLFTGGDPIAFLVRWQSRSNYSHAALLIPGTNRVIESYPGPGVRERELKAKDWERIHAFRVTGMRMEEWTHALGFATQQMKMRYDWRSVFKFLTRTPARENGKWFCSELVFRAIEVSFRRILNMRAEYVNPGHLASSPFLERDTKLELAMLEALGGEE